MRARRRPYWRSRGTWRTCTAPAASAATRSRPVSCSPIERLSARQLKGFRAERLLENASRPEDVANLVVFLASDQASCITGQTYVIDAGTMAKRPRAAMRMWEDMLQTGAVAFEGE
jgi:enoyl-[acyl-carrier-protein] reductase (NADH)